MGIQTHTAHDRSTEVMSMIKWIRTSRSLMKKSVPGEALEGVFADGQVCLIRRGGNGGGEGVGEGEGRMETERDRGRGRDAGRLGQKGGGGF